ncbi:LysR family transcriptional regulator [Roseomonas sp. SG15]|uniref:LysR family transcriptional regulator n=2 Tax=Roseomonas indoligenes TaxID=2820811 RepID=A0A940S8A8_9PROT|nr:LysR family transcriptional regulator [Pararoseomonas indoligenes]
MDFRQLRYFLAVAEELNFTRAALRVGIAQPPLSAQIRALEEELGTSLFLRDKRRVSLTPAGEAMVRHTRHILQQAARAADEVRAIRDGRQGVIGIGAVYATIYTLIPRVLRRLAQTHPGITVRVEEMTVAQQVHALTAEEIDVGVLRGSVTDPELEIRVIQEEPFVVALPADNPLVNEQVLDPETLLPQPFIVVTQRPGSDYAARIADVFLQTGRTPQIVQEVKDMHTLIGLVAAGIGVAIVPASVTALQPPHVAFRPLRAVSARMVTSIAWRRGDASPLLPVLVAALSEEARLDEPRQSPA